MTNGELYGLSGSEGTFRLYGGIVGCVGSSKSTTGISIFGSNPPKENPISVEIHQGTVVGSNYAIQSYGVSKLMISGGTLSGGTADLYLNVYDGATITNANMGGEVFGGEITWVAYTPSATIASGTCGENLNWKLTEDGTLTISGSGDMYEFSNLASSEPPWEANEDQIVHVNIKPGVTSIGSYAFYWLEQLETVSIPEGITKIGDDAFFLCSKLSGIDIPESVTTIGEYAFNGCFKLTRIMLSSNVSSLGTCAFAACDGVPGIWVDSENPYFSNDEHGVLYNKDKTTLLQMSSGFTGEFTVPGSVTVIGECAFWFCDGMTSISLSENVTSIGNYAFNRCSGLTSIDLPSGLKFIDNDAFSNCNNIGEITIPASVEKMGINPFQDMAKLSWITVEEGNEFFCNDEYGVLFNKDKTVLIAIPALLDVKYSIPEGVKEIGEDACKSKNIPAVVIPASVEKINNWSFSYCEQLKEIIFLGDAPKMETYAFSGTTATCYYPADNATWTESVRQNYGGTLTWVEQTPEVDYIPGDVNGDNVVDLLDVITLVHTAVANGRWCGVERPECGAPAAG